MGCGPSYASIKRDVLRDLEKEKRDREREREEIHRTIATDVDHNFENLHRQAHCGSGGRWEIMHYEDEVLFAARRLIKRVFLEWDGVIYYQFYSNDSPSKINSGAGLLIFDARDFLSNWFPIPVVVPSTMYADEDEVGRQRKLRYIILRYKRACVIEYDFTRSELHAVINHWPSDVILRAKLETIREQEQAFKIVNSRQKKPLPRCLVNYIGSFLTGLGGKRPLPF